jgi:hypothetical protein
MHIVRRTMGVLSILSLIVVPSAWAQQDTSAIPSHQVTIDRALASRAAQVAAERAAIRRVLDRAEVREVAARSGIDLERVRAGVALLDGQDLQKAADQARTVDAALAGGASSVTLSTTMIIIILLVVILIIVAVK